jgi:ABC-type multidrug transport system ATPase subunit
LLDEPTTGLDPRGRRDLWSAIQNPVADGTDVLLTTQYLEEADRLARQIVIIDHGRVITAETLDELKDRAGRNVTEVRPPSHNRPAPARRVPLRHEQGCRCRRPEQSVSVHADSPDGHEHHVAGWPEVISENRLSNSFLGNLIEICIVTRNHRRTMEGMVRLGIGPWRVHPSTRPPSPSRPTGASPPSTSSKSASRRPTT